MHFRARTALVFVLASVVVAGCAAPQRGGESSPAEQLRSGPKRIVAAIAGDPVSVNQAVTRATLAYSVPGGEFLELLAHRGLAIADDKGNLVPALAEAVPTVESGLWVLLPDGRMEMTWQIRDGARWHDGTPVSADDLLFSARLRRDSQLPVLRNRNYDLVESIEATDARTIVLKWKQPFIEADALLNPGPFPRHLLEATYLENKENLMFLPYWTGEFIGAGPYRIKEWSQGSHATFQAHDAYVLGRPPVDEIEVRFIPDSSTLIANVLAGTVEMTVGRGFSIEQATQVSKEWSGGRAEIAPSSWIVIFPQFMNPNPPVVADARFRRALIHALDRKQMADSIQGGHVPLADTFFGPDDVEYAEAQRTAARYDYDPRRAMELIAEIGYTRSGDGMFADATGQKITLPIWTSGGLDVQVKSMFTAADYWQKVGINAEPVVVPTQRWNDPEYVANFPALRLNRQGTGRGFMKNMHSAETPLPENRYTGNNYSRYRNPELDALIDRFFLTVPTPERAQIVERVVRHVTEQAQLIGLYSDAQPILVGRRIQHVTAQRPGWNVHLWDVA